MGSYVRVIGWLALVAAAIALIAGCGSGAAATAPGADKAGPTPVNGPRIAVSPDSFDFGNVPLDKVVGYTFKIKNVGSEALVIFGEPPVRVLQGC